MEISLTRGLTCVVDDEDFKYISNRKWFAQKCGKSFYAATNINCHIIYLHRFLMNLPENKRVDHRDGNTLNNRKENLRLATPQQNNWNKKKMGKYYKGVCFDKQTNKYIAQIGYNYKNIKLGRFNTPEEARDAYNIKAKELYGEFFRE